MALLPWPSARHPYCYLPARWDPGAYDPGVPGPVPGDPMTQAPQAPEPTPEELQPQPPKLTNEQHHAHPAIGSSDLKLFRRSPLHYWHRKYSPSFVPKPPSASMQMGTALHIALLEPERFEKAVGQALTTPKTSKAAKEAHAEHDAKYELTIPPAAYQQVLAMRDVALKHPVIKRIAETVVSTEESVFAIDPTTGLELKIRLDAWTSPGWLIDVKTTADASNGKFKWSIRDYGYDHQAAYYLKVLRLAGRPPQGQLLVLLESEAPHAARVVRLPDDAINAAAVTNEICLQEIAEHLQQYGQDQPWPAYENTIVEFPYDLR
ncbi:PD-(D/E)XK nuclease-like domain-containing protein [Cyanophage S-2L]|nr:PD-(D/E)XK nuclease-like domain-containing protein [Cyanophage S-2L]